MEEWHLYFCHPLNEERKDSLIMSVQYKINIISALKDAGYSTYRLRKERLFGEATLQKFRNSELVSWENISTVCRLLNCQPGDILEYVPDAEEQ